MFKHIVKDKRHSSINPDNNTQFNYESYLDLDMMNSKAFTGMNIHKTEEHIKSGMMINSQKNSPNKAKDSGD